MRHAQRIERISLQGEVLITDDPKADTTGNDRVLYFKPPFGPYQADLAETYPFNAEVPEEADGAALDQAVRITKELMRTNPGARFGFRMRREGLDERMRE